jgi:putative redox protein
MIDKSKELTATVKLVNDRLKFSGIVEGNGPVSIDYIPPFGDGMGYTSLELLLLSFSTCLGSAVLVFLRRMQKSVTAFEIIANGIRNQDHPTGFRSIEIMMNLRSDDVTEAVLNKVIALAEDKYCPVWSMIKGNVDVLVNFKINEDAYHMQLH